MGSVGYWALLPLAVMGGVVLRKRNVSLIPLVAPFVVTFVTVAVTYGQPRLRAATEVPLVLLAAVGIEWLFTRGAKEAAPDQHRARESQSDAPGSGSTLAPTQAGVGPS